MICTYIVQLMAFSVCCMPTLFIPEQDRKQLLREWVLKNGDAAAVEASIVVSKSSSSKLGTQKELLTVQEMVSKGYPAEKISAIVAKGGIPDPDCPHIPSLYKYWCQTSCVLKDVEEVKQESKVTVQCQPNAAALDAVMSGPKGPAKRCALPTGCLEQMMQSTQSPGPGFSILVEILHALDKDLSLYVFIHLLYMTLNGGLYLKFDRYYLFQYWLCTTPFPEPTTWLYT